MSQKIKKDNLQVSKTLNAGSNCFEAPSNRQGREVCGQIVRTCVEILHEVTSSMIVTEVKFYFSS
jgi:hypothetical protein